MSAARLAVSTLFFVPYERLPLPDGSTATGLGNVLFNLRFGPFFL